MPEAEREFRAAFSWYSERSPMAAHAFRSIVFDVIDSLADSADRWPVDLDGFHFCVLSRFPYTIWYDLTGETAAVLAISHQHRRPNYWKLRDD